MIDTEKLDTTFRSCMLKDEEVPDGLRTSEDPFAFCKGRADVVMAEGIASRGFAFHAGRLEESRGAVRAMLAELPENAREDSEGGGISFLSACMDREGNQWGEHRNVEQLLSLGAALGLVRFLLPREMWSILPGGMPYFAVTG